MQTAEPSIVLENISKVYRIPKHGRESIIGSLSALSDAMTGNYGKKHKRFDYFSALHPFSLSVGAGESVAIVGRNGSGKSTLLEIIAGTLKPTSGTVEVTGRISALLQLGSGFNPEFTGIENIYLNGTMMGLTRSRIDEKLEDILSFADIGEFVYQPVRTYSSGMRLRLAFAVITAVDPDILIVDEALSVGDAFFQSRCVRWLEAYLEKKKTFLCVSHDMFMIRRLCQRGIVLNEGNIACDADVAEAANLYYRLHRGNPVLQRRPTGPAGDQQLDDQHADTANTNPDTSRWSPVELDYKERTGDGSVTIESVQTNPSIDSALLVDDWLGVLLHLRAHRDMEAFNVGFGFRDRSGLLIGGIHTLYDGTPISGMKAQQERFVEFEVKLHLKPQSYLLVIGLAINHTGRSWQDLDCIWDCAKLDVGGSEPFWGLAPLPMRNFQVNSAKD